MKSNSVWLGVVLAAGLIALTVGCSSVTRGTPATGFGKADIQANLARSDLEIIGPVEGQSTKEVFFFGLVNVIDGEKLQLLGIKFFEDQYAYVEGGGFGVTEKDRAFYKALAATPDADAIFTKSHIFSVSGFWPFYLSKQATFQGKAIKYKADPHR